MKNQVMVLGIILIGSLFFKPITTEASIGYANGSGTESDPYLISTAEQLNQLQVDVNINNESTSGKYYQLINNITLTNFDSDDSISNGNWTPIGSVANHFAGHFDGNGYTVSNISIHLNSDYVGFFGYTIGATIENLTLSHLEVSGQNRVGGLVGSLSTNSILNQTAVSGNIQATGERVGGLVGHVYKATISNSASTGKVQATSYVGGLAGYIQNSTLFNSYSHSATQATNTRIGGLIGYSLDTTIEYAFSTGDVTGTSTYIGGLVGMNSGSTIKESYWDFETSNCLNSDGGTGVKTETLIKKRAKSTLIGFDFENIWRLSSMYPELRWQEGVEYIPMDSDITITGDIQATIASITVPSATLTFVIDTTQSDEQQFIAPTLTLFNDSNAPLSLELYTFEQPIEVLNDVLPEAHSDWSNLGVQDALDFALALNPQPGVGWLTLQEGPRYVKTIDSSYLGVIKPKSSVWFNFTAQHGTSFNKVLNPVYQVTFVFDLADNH